ncbi:hypothetical protein [Mongoliitalea lutea]|uniref:Uncharacterized protein n=1 Tax=Mongoliitalea lutea TaxID=849756 RepID=A0A8J3CX63_9BACT|nr:hypothetical protein [Mongoliitalea lutea]GHB37038.1 hypothetical protein GCM10008106_17900 [Mongoliitalea lutea]
MKVGIVHYAPVEKYPPVMNDVIDLDHLNKHECLVFTSGTSDPWFSPAHARIFRIGQDFFTTSVRRYWHYVHFALNVFFKLLWFKPSLIICYETVSILPVFLLNLVFGINTRIHIHYHEYTSIKQYRNSSLYNRLLHKLEKKLWKCHHVTVSHTNIDRKRLFLEDYRKILNESRVQVFPNLPPKHWYEVAQQLKTSRAIQDKQVISLVHVGATDLDSMYVQELLTWVISQSGKYEIDFYISYAFDNTLSYLNRLTTQYEFIRVKKPVRYEQLPEILTSYDVGLVLYNGDIPNHIYNVPNKVFEYLICGLEVVYSQDLISTNSFVKDHSINGCYPLDFSKIKFLPTTKNQEFNKNLFFEGLTNNENKIQFLLNGNESFIASKKSS